MEDFDRKIVVVFVLGKCFKEDIKVIDLFIDCVVKVFFGEDISELFEFVIVRYVGIVLDIGMSDEIIN